MSELWRRRAGGIVVVAALAVLVSVAVGTVRGAVPQAAAQLEIIPGVPERVMALPAPLVSRLRSSKQVADVEELRRLYFVRNGIPHLRALGVECPLLPVNRLERRPTEAQVQASQVLTGPIAKYRDLILSKPVHIPEPPPDVVDHRPQQTAIKNQNPRGTCYAFASIAGMEAAYGGGSLDLSECYANYWFQKAESQGCKADGVDAFDWGAVLRDHGVCTETVCPYLVSPYPAYCNNGLDPAPTKRSDAQTRAAYRITGYTALWRDETVSDSGVYINNPGYLRSVLATGKDVVVGLFVAGWTDSSMGDVIDVRLGPGGDPLPASGGHVMLIVGYDDPSQYFIVKNSWGDDSGHDGYLYMTYDYMRTYAQLGFVINEVRPVLRRLRAPAVMKRAP